MIEFRNFMFVRIADFFQFGVGIKAQLFASGHAFKDLPLGGIVVH